MPTEVVGVEGGESVSVPESGPPCPICGLHMGVELRSTGRGRPYWYAACVVPQHLKLFIHYAYVGVGWMCAIDCPVCGLEFVWTEEIHKSGRTFWYVQCENRCARGFSHVSDFDGKVARARRE